MLLDQGIQERKINEMREGAPFGQKQSDEHPMGKTENQRHLLGNLTNYLDVVNMLEISKYITSTKSKEHLNSPLGIEMIYHSTKKFYDRAQLFAGKYVVVYFLSCQSYWFIWVWHISLNLFVSLLRLDFPFTLIRILI